MNKILKIGTRESQLAVWQAKEVQQLLEKHDVHSALVYISSEGDIDLETPLYEIGVQGIFTKALDIALLKGEIDIAVHSMKDVPTSLAKGVVQVAVLPRASYNDILVLNPSIAYPTAQDANYTIATSSIRRKAQWLNKYPNSKIENLRGNVNTRLRKVHESTWNGAIFAAAGLERIALRPATAIDLSWMLPAPAQGAIVIVCRQGDEQTINACLPLNHEMAATCTQVERDFLKALMGGCATPISALAQWEDSKFVFQGNILSPDGRQKAEIVMPFTESDAARAGELAAQLLLNNGGKEIVELLNDGQ